MNKYELCVVLSAKLEDGQRSELIEKIKSQVTRFGGSIISDVEDWGKKKLAYTVDGMNEGYYNFIQFEGKNTTPRELEDTIRIMENVVRFLIVKQDA